MLNRNNNWSGDQRSNHGVLRLHSKTRIASLLILWLMVVGSCLAQEPFSKKAAQVAAALQDKDPKALPKIIATIDPLLDLSDETKLSDLRKAVESISADQKEPALLRALELIKSTDLATRKTGGLLVSFFGQQAASKLNSLLTSQDPSVRSSAILGLANIGWDSNVAVPKLILIIQNDKDPNVKETAINTLAIFGPRASSARTTLLNSLNQNVNIRKAAVLTLGMIYAERTRDAALPRSEDELTSVCQPLILMLKEDIDVVRQAAAGALGSIRAKLDSVIPALTAALKDPDAGVRAAAAYAIGSRSVNLTDEKRKNDLIYTKQALPELIRLVATEGENIGVKKSAAVSISSIAFDASGLRDTSLLDQLEIAQRTISQDNDPNVQQFAAGIEASVRLLQREKLYERFFWLRYVLIAIGAYAFLFLCCLSLLFVRPLWILRLNQRLASLDQIKLPDWLGGLRIPVRYLLVLGFYHYHPRVLDAWVGIKLPQARTRFQSLNTVKDRSVHIPVPVFLENRVIADLTGADLRFVFNQQRNCLLIWGEGGGGKTSLACQLGKWAMSESKVERLCDHAMLPVVLEQELDYTVAAERSPFLAAIQGSLRAIVGDPEEVSDDLLNRLLLNRRVLVIIDHFSEFSEETRAKVRPGASDFPAYALVVTSRIEEKLDQVPKTVIKPMRVEGNRLSTFMESYLLQRSEQENLFNDAEKFDSYSRLSSLTGDRDVTVLLAKLFAEQMIALKKNLGEDRLIGGSLPTNIPDLMLSYLNELNKDLQDKGLETTIVHRAAKEVAWHCLKESYRPGRARVVDVLEALKDLGNAKVLIGYLEKKLRIVQTLEPAREYLRFTLDPLAEYLAGLRAVEIFGDVESLWTQFLNGADSSSGAPGSIKEFLAAIRDCCLVRLNETKVPSFVVEGLSLRAGLDPETLRMAQLRQRLQRLISLLTVPEGEDRLFAVRAIGRIGPDASPVAEYLRELIKRDHDEEVREAARISLTQIDADGDDIF